MAYTYVIRNIDFDIFSEKENFSKFIENSVLQYIKFKFGNKNNLVSFIKRNFGIEIPKTASYDEIDKILRKKSKDFYRDVLGVEFPIEIVHLYSLYKMLTDIFWETTWTKTFSPFYNRLFDEKIKIRKKSELREYARKIITSFNEHDLANKWEEISSTTEIYRPVIHYKHLTFGPLGFKLSLYYREKEIFGCHEPILMILGDTTPAGEYIVDWERTDAFKVFSAIQNELNTKITDIRSNYPLYKDYLTSVGFEFPYTEWKQNSLELVRELKVQLKENKIPLWFYQIVQYTGMFFKDKEIIDLLNKLIAENRLVINPELSEIEDLKITKDGIIKRPKSWLARPAFELASDIISTKSKSSEEDFRRLLTDILQIGTIKYLEQMFDKDFETFKAICTKRGLHKFALLDRHALPKETAIRFLLESYGLQTPSADSLNIRFVIELFLSANLSEFRGDYKEMGDLPLIENIRGLLDDGRTYLERLLKEWLFIMISLVVHYEDQISRGSSKDIFLLDRPIPYISPYNREQELNRAKEEFKEFLGRFNVSEDLKKKINEYATEGRANFTLGDWYSLVSSLMKYIEQESNLANNFWESLPKHFHEDIDKRVSELERYFIKENALKWLNKAHHEALMVELRRSIESREEALNALLKSDKIISSTLQSLPELITITEKVTEAKTGLEYHKAEYISNENSYTLKIYGTRFIELSFLYHLITRFEENSNIVTYPILITDLTDTIF